MKVKRVTLVDDDLINRYGPIDHIDAYETLYVSEKELSPGDVMLAFWTIKPRWIERLFSLRDILVKPLGLRGTKKQEENVFEDCILSGKATELISITDQSERKIVLKLNDNHLCAWLAVITEEIEDSNSFCIKLVTLVKYHRLLGRLYFAVISPFHHLIVRYMLKYVVNYLSEKRKEGY